MSEETLPPYVVGSPIKGIVEVLDRGRVVVRLPDNSLAICSPMPTVIRHLPWEMSSDYLKAWTVSSSLQNKYPKKLYAVLHRLCDDPRMKCFWDWLPSVEFRDLAVRTTSYTVGMQIWQSMQMPEKPGNLPPAQRTAYFEKIRKHATALRDLLKDTLFDNSDMHLVPEEKLEKPLADTLYSWGVDESEEGHTISFRIKRDGIFQYHWTYPQSDLTETLCYLEEWTYWDDLWDGSFDRSSAPIAQANSENAQAIYFNCMLFDWFQKHGVSLPFPVLATVANVALNVAAEKQLDEDTVRKQVRRYQARRAEHAGSDVTDTGQNFTN